VHPAGAVGDAHAGGARGGNQPRLGGDELLGLGRQLLEVGQEGITVVRVGERVAAADADADPFGELPGDGFGGQRGRRGLLRDCTFLRYPAMVATTSPTPPATRKNEIQYVQTLPANSMGAL
jgi:hypothetical protein